MTKNQKLIAGIAALALLGGAGFYLTNSTEPKFPEGSEKAVEAVKRDMAEKAGTNPDEVKILSVSKREWPDACLGLERTGQACAQVITPGYEIEAQVKGQDQRYVYRTNMDGTVLVRSIAAYL